MSTIKTRGRTEVDGTLNLRLSLAPEMSSQIVDVEIVVRPASASTTHPAGPMPNLPEDPHAEMRRWVRDQGLEHTIRVPPPGLPPFEPLPEHLRVVIPPGEKTGAEQVVEDRE